jgi:hypothetical protein
MRAGMGCLAFVVLAVGVEGAMILAQAPVSWIEKIVTVAALFGFVSVFMCFCSIPFWDWDL